MNKRRARTFTAEGERAMQRNAPRPRSRITALLWELPIAYICIIIFFSPYNQLVLPAHLQLSRSNVSPGALSFNISDRLFILSSSAIVCMLFGMLYTLFLLSSLILILLPLSSCQFYKQLKTHLSLHSYPLYLVSLLDWPLETLIRPVCHS